MAQKSLDQSIPTTANKSTQAKQPLQRSPLITEPISTHDVPTMLAAVRTAIENGADVNQLDTETTPHLFEGRPLDACLAFQRMPGRKSIIENLPVIELLLEHGADPRLWSEVTGALRSPVSLALEYSKDEGLTEKTRDFWKRVFELFKEAIARIDAKKEAIGPIEQESDEK